MLLRRFAVIKLWPELETAEDECIARLKVAASSSGLECLVVDSFARLIAPPHTRLTSADVDFVISLHFDTPKCYDIYSFAALWNPLQFFHEWGYRRCARNLMSHDDYLSCASNWADDHVNRQICHDPRRDGPRFRLFHSLAEPLLKPDLGEKKIFYAGINWERLSKQRGRHHELLKLLEQGGDLRLYGPREFQGVDVWAGFRSYVGPVPFDGISMVRLIHQAGIALVLSSPAHRESELMSSRLFESLAGGAVIICDENPFGQRHFGDTLLYIDTRLGPEEACAQIRKHVEWVKAEPEKALDLARRAQEIFHRDFTLDKCLTRIYEGFPARKEKMATLYRPRKAEGTIAVFFLLPEAEPAALERHVASYRAQRDVRMQPVFVLDQEASPQFQQQVQARLDEAGIPGAIELAGFVRDFGNGDTRLRLGEIIDGIIRRSRPEEYLCVVAPNERLFSDHFAALVRALEDCEEAGAAWSDMLLAHKSGGNDYADVSEDPKFGIQSSNKPLGWGRFLLRTSALKPELRTVLPYLDVLAMHLLGGVVKSVSTGRATLLTDIQDKFNLQFSDAQAVKEREILIDYAPENFEVRMGLDGPTGALAPVSLSLENMRPEAKTKLAVELAHSVPVPGLFKKLGVGLYRMWLHRPGRR